MAPNITCQTILVPTNRSGAIEQGILVFADDTLVAVLKRLEKCTGDDVTDLCGRWFVESGYGPCTVAPGTEHLLLSLAEVQQWVLEKVTRAYENEGPQFV